MHRKAPEKRKGITESRLEERQSGPEESLWNCHDRPWIRKIKPLGQQSPLPDELVPRRGKG